MDPRQASVALRPARSYHIGSWLYLRGLGVVYLVAFASLWVQIHGLVGSDGILPVGEYLERVASAGGQWKVPTLLWIAHGDAALHVLCCTGVLVSVLLIVGMAPLPSLLVLWATYLSLVHGGQTFLSFQWDTLLLEAGFVALFLAPAGLRNRAPETERPPPRVGLWLVWLLLFKLMFLSGVVKLISLDDTWWKLTALDYHYFTQPIPMWTSWYAHHLPVFVQRLSVLGMFVIEIAVPFAIFVPAARRAVVVALVALQLSIAATGNYGFFNLLTIVICLPLLDDRLFARIGIRLRSIPRDADSRRRHPWQRAARAVRTLAAIGLIGVTTLTLLHEMIRSLPPGKIGGVVGSSFDRVDRTLVQWGRRHVLSRTAPFRTVNGYGLFRAMTTERPELVLEGSTDGRTWVAYELPWKPGNPARPPGVAAPHMPRLDWQMWFAALNPRRAAPWLERLMLRVLEGSPTVLALFDTDPFDGEPPRYVRLAYYRYEFTSPATRRETGAWWKRERLGELTSPLSLDPLRRQDAP